MNSTDIIHILFTNAKGATLGALSILLQILLYPLPRLNHILAMAEGRQPEVPFAAGAETGTGRADHVAVIDGFVEERKKHVSARRNSIRMHTKSQLSLHCNRR